MREEGRLREEGEAEERTSILLSPALSFSLNLEEGACGGGGYVPYSLVVRTSYQLYFMRRASVSADTALSVSG